MPVVAGVDRSSMMTDDLGDDGQTEPGSPCRSPACGVRPVEPLEHRVQDFRRNVVPVVPD